MGELLVRLAAPPTAPSLYDQHPPAFWSRRATLTERLNAAQLPESVKLRKTAGHRQTDRQTADS